MIKCSPEAFTKCKTMCDHCRSEDVAFFLEGSDCDKFNKEIASAQKTHADRIRAMSDEELAVLMTSIQIDTINEMCKKFNVEIEMPVPTVENTADVCEWLKQSAEEREWATTPCRNDPGATGSEG